MIRFKGISSQSLFFSPPRAPTLYFLSPVVLEIDLRALYMLGKYYTTELYCQPQCSHSHHKQHQEDVSQCWVCSCINSKSGGCVWKSRKPQDQSSIFFGSWKRWHPEPREDYHLPSCLNLPKSPLSHLRLGLLCLFVLGF